MKRCYIRQWDLYRVICDFYADDKTFHGGETTTRMLFLGRAGKDLRCVRFRHCWDHTPSFARANLAAYDGLTEEHEDYDVITYSQDAIENALMQATDTAYYGEFGHPVAVELLGNGDTTVNAWLYFPTEVGKDFSALRQKIEETYGIHFPQSLVDWYREGVPFSIEDSWLFPDWLNLSEPNVAKIKELMDKPKEWILCDVQKGTWHSAWGEQPSGFDEAVEKVRNLFDDMPPLIPVCSHRYMLCLDGNDDPPIISIAGYDTVLYGSNLKEYLEVDFGGGLLPDEAAVPMDMDFIE